MVVENPPRPSSALSSLELTQKRTRNPRRVLVVEDNIDSVRALSALLADMGHSVSYAINGYAALEIGRKFRPEIAILDLGLPGMDGYDLARRMRQDSAFAGTRLIALTAYGDEHHRQRAKEAGIGVHLLKPCPAQVLFDVIENWKA